MSLLNRINKAAKEKKKNESLIRQLFLNMIADKSLSAQIDKLIEDNKDTLTTSALQELKDNSMEFLLRDSERVQKKGDPLNLMIDELDSQLDSPTRGFTLEAFNQQAKPLFDSLRTDLKLKLKSDEIETLWQGVVSEFVGYGPFDALIADDTIREIVALGQNMVYVRKDGRLERLRSFLFRDDFHYKKFIDRIFPHDADESRLPIRSKKLSDNTVAFCLYQYVDYMSPFLMIHKYS